jgi:hypothetical protein
MSDKHGPKKSTPKCYKLQVNTFNIKKIIHTGMSSPLKINYPLYPETHFTILFNFQVLFPLIFFHSLSELWIVQSKTIMYFNSWWWSFSKKTTLIVYPFYTINIEWYSFAYVDPFRIQKKDSFNSVWKFIFIFFSLKIYKELDKNRKVLDVHFNFVI